MANLSIRNLDENVYTQLRLLAAEHGISMEEEVRQIISHAIATPEKITTVFRKYFGLKNGLNLETPLKKPHEPMDFTE